MVLILYCLYTSYFIFGYNMDRHHRIRPLIRVLTVCHASSNILNMSTSSGTDFTPYRTSMVSTNGYPVVLKTVFRVISNSKWPYNYLNIIIVYTIVLYFHIS